MLNLINLELFDDNIMVESLPHSLTRSSDIYSKMELLVNVTGFWEGYL